MDKKVTDYRKDVVRALKAAGKYSKSLEIQITSLASALFALDMANRDMEVLDSTTISVTSRYGNDTIAPHPVFKIQKDAQDSVTRQMKALGLTAEELAGADEDDPLINLTKDVRRAAKRKSVTIKRP